MNSLPVTLVHGFMGDPSDWEFMRSELGDRETVAPLIRPARDWQAGVEQLAEEIPQRSILVGYSMGARLSLALALTYPERCAGLVFCSGNPGIEDDAMRSSRLRADHDIAQRIEQEDRQTFLHHWYTESTVFRSLTDAVREDEIRRKAARTGDDWSAILRAYSVAEQPDYWPRMEQLKVPVMAIAGISDRKYARMMARMGSLPNIDARVVPACGHIVHREQPYVFLQLMKMLIARVPDEVLA